MFRVVDGTTYRTTTPQAVVQILELAREKRVRLHIWYGDTDTGELWGEEKYPDETGYIGRSCGDMKIPLAVHNARSLGGGSILDHCIVRIRPTKGKTWAKKAPHRVSIFSYDLKAPFPIRKLRTRAI